MSTFPYLSLCKRRCAHLLKISLEKQAAHRFSVRLLVFTSFFFLPCHFPQTHTHPKQNWSVTSTLQARVVVPFFPWSCIFISLPWCSSSLVAWWDCAMRLSSRLSFSSRHLSSLITLTSTVRLKHTKNMPACYFLKIYVGSHAWPALCVKPHAFMRWCP